MTFYTFKLKLKPLAQYLTPVGYKFKLIFTYLEKVIRELFFEDFC